MAPICPIYQSSRCNIAYPSKPERQSTNYHEGVCLVPFCKIFAVLGDKAVLSIRVSCAGEDHSASHDGRRTKNDALGVTVIMADQSTRDRSSSKASKTDDKR